MSNYSQAQPVAFIKPFKSLSRVQLKAFLEAQKAIYKEDERGFVVESRGHLELWVPKER